MGAKGHGVTKPSHLTLAAIGVCECCNHAQPLCSVLSTTPRPGLCKVYYSEQLCLCSRGVWKLLIRSLRFIVSKIVSTYCLSLREQAAGKDGLGHWQVVSTFWALGLHHLCLWSLGSLFPLMFLSNTSLHVPRLFKMRGGVRGILNLPHLGVCGPCFQLTAPCTMIHQNWCLLPVVFLTKCISGKWK